MVEVNQYVAGLWQRFGICVVSRIQTRILHRLVKSGLHHTNTQMSES